MSDVELLPNEIWAVILKYLNYVDILSIKFLSKRCFNISFLNSRFEYFRGLAKQLTDCVLYYQKINAVFDNFIRNLKSDISLPNWLYLNYFFNQLKDNLLLSSCFCHLFHCPRSLFAKNNCQLCSRRFIKTLIRKPKNFDRLFTFTFADRLLKEYCDISFKGLEPLLFFKSYDEMVMIESDRKRCLTTCVVTAPCKIGKLFLEVFLRILVNACYDFANILSESEELIFLEKFFDFVISHIPDFIAKFDFKTFIKIFSENDYSSPDLKITNKNFISYCSKKYAC